jgi:hypothetical protein
LSTKYKHKKRLDPNRAATRWEVTHPELTDEQKAEMVAKIQRYRARHEGLLNVDPIDHFMLLKLTHD